MVFIQSYYNAASIYYFSRMYEKALIVIEDGVKFSCKVFSKRFKNDRSIIDKGQFNVWSWLFRLLVQDISKRIPETTLRNIFKISDIDEKLYHPKLKIENQVFPSSVVLFYRRYFLNDEIIEEKTMEIFKDWANKIDVNSIDKDIMYTKNISMYSFLVFFSFGEKYEDKLENIIKAIQLPVLSVEDRLLNYKANQLAEEFISFCLDESELSYYMPCYSKIKKQMEQNQGFPALIMTA
ncbi:uncharacterized protein LOC111042631 [Myzus persicae]|uniref:uncharacterized protein LOC111042631 n=1 Tax=Myzus persicae TaxID=13164 RepID=UPI000B935EE1|nr:uncharacterized protein LOC111042631 [Myzus persicae]